MEPLNRATRSSAILFTLTVCGIAQQYSVTDLGMLPGATSAVATGVNSSGTIVGYVDGGPYSCPHAFQYKNGLMSDLGNLLPGGCTAPTHINDSGDIVGNANSTPTSPQRAFIIRGGQLQFLFSSNEAYSRARWINSSGQVVGTVAFNTPPPGVGPGAAFVWNNGTTTFLPQAGAFAEAFSINTSGHIVGQPPFLYAAGQLTTLPALPGYTPGAASAINDSDQIVGYSVASSGFFRAFLYQNGTISDLGTLGSHSTPNSINSSGTIVGASNNSAFIYRNTQLIDLNTVIPSGSGWLLISAIRINDSGQIVGYGAHNGVISGFLLTPLASPTGTITVTSVPSGASFHLAGPNGTVYNGTTPFSTTTAPFGDYVITWNHLAGFAYPPSGPLVQTLIPAIDSITFTALFSPSPCSSTHIDTSQSNDQVDVSLSPTGACDAVLTIRNHKNYWTNFQLSSTGSATFTPVSDSAPYIQGGVLPPSGLVGSSTAVIYNIHFSRPGETITIFVDPTGQLGKGQAEDLNFVQVWLNALPFGSIPTVVISDAQTITQAFAQMPHLRTAVHALFSSSPDLIAFVINLGQFLFSGELFTYQSMVLTIEGSIALTVIKAIFGAPWRVINTLISVFGNVRDFAFRYPTGSVLITSH